VIVLGIDPGSRCMGYGVLDAGGRDEQALDYGVLRLDTEDDHPTRLKIIFDRVGALVEAHHPSVCAIEMPVYGRNPQSMLKLGRAQAAAMLAALDAGLAVAQYTPAEVKQSVTGNGNASKDQVGFMVRSILKLGREATLPHDAADALAIALCHGNRQAHGAPEHYTGWASFVDANPDRVAK
jgi:crossover junction endodeoxyribonuclease RuvC